jgi:hypothetical protein
MCSLESEVFAASSSLASAPALARFERDQVAESYNLEMLQVVHTLSIFLLLKVETLQGQ